MNKSTSSPKIKKSEHIFALKIKTESNGLGVLKTLIVLLLIVLQASLLVFSYLYFLQLFKWYFTFSIILTLIACIHVLSSDFHGQAKATWVLFLLLSFGFGYIIYTLSDKRVLFKKSKKKYNKILAQTKKIKTQNKLSPKICEEVKTNCNYLYNVGNFVAHQNTKTKYYSSGAKLFDDILESLENAKEFVFIEFFIISNGVLLNRFLDVLSKKAKEGVDVRIIYDDMGSHGTLKRKTKKQILKVGIKLQTFNRLVPVFNIALNLRNHRKIVVCDGKVAFTGGANLADEYVNEKRVHGYWKDAGIKIEGSAVDNFTLAYLEEWQFLTGNQIEYSTYLKKSDVETKTQETPNDLNVLKLDLSEEIIAEENSEVVVPFVSGPNYNFSIAQNIFANEISNAKEKLYIMSPYFIPDETITNLLINKARSGVDVKIILPEIADKKFVYIVSRNNAEKLLNFGVKTYTMKSSFVHSKVILTENSAIVGSINMDLRSFNQQFESAVFLNSKQVLLDINADFTNTINHSTQITTKNCKRQSFLFRVLAGIFNLISPFM